MMSGKGGMEIIQEKAKYASDQINLAATTAEQRLKYVLFHFLFNLSFYTLYTSTYEVLFCQSVREIEVQRGISVVKKS